MITSKTGVLGITASLGELRKRDECAGVEDLVVARELVGEIENAELFLYPGDGHLFADSSLGDFDEEAAALLKKRPSKASRRPRRASG